MHWRFLHNRRGGRVHFGEAHLMPPTGQFQKSQHTPGLARGFGGCRDVWRCGPTGCGAWHVCARSCPDRYSCFSLVWSLWPLWRRRVLGGLYVRGLGKSVVMETRTGMTPGGDRPATAGQNDRLA